MSMQRLLTLVLFLGIASLIPSPRARAQTKAEFDKARKSLVEDVLKRGGIKNAAVLKSMSETLRHEFVEAKLRDKAYFDMSLPIGDKQTISSPFVVAYMTESIDPQPADKVLEIGTGSGYQAAVLSPLVKEVYSIEIVKPLGDRAARTLKRLKYENVFTMVGDGYLGWPEHAPFDKIIVTCSPEKVPAALVEQLKEGGLMIIPVGERYQQTLYLMRKKDGAMVSEALRPTLFVPMTGAAEDIRVVKPDPLNPKAVNGNFEEDPGKSEFVPGWYYHQQVTLVRGRGAPEGTNHVVFRNSEPGRSAHMLQGFPIDGRKVKELELSARVKLDGVFAGPEAENLPAIVITFYDDNRKDLGHFGVMSLRGTFDWRRVSERIRIPPMAREGILRIGMFEATGEAAFDDVRMTPLK
jgi:protein-L-isoaspartate(D-aspartate) O-methyltransferase